MSNKLRYAIVMLIGVAMNQFFGFLAVRFNLPVWLDVTGTAFTALALEPTAGLLVGLVDNFYLAIVSGDNSKIIYFAISALVALIVGAFIKKDGKIKSGRILPAILIIIVASAGLETVLTIWRGSFVPSGNWEMLFCNMALSYQFNAVVACFTGVFIVKTLDTIATGVIVAVSYIIYQSIMGKKNGEAGRISPDVRAGG